MVGGASLEEEAWKLPSSAEKRSHDEIDSTVPKPFVRAATVVASPRLAAADKTLTERNVGDEHASAATITAATPSLVRACAVGADAPAMVAVGVAGVGSAVSGAENALSNGGSVGGGGASPNEVINVSAALLGGRQAYKACLAPLRLPVADVSDAASPKRMRTPNGSAPGAAATCASSVRGGTGLRISAQPPEAHENVVPVGPVLASCAASAAPLASAFAAGPNGPLSCTSPMSELLSLSIFGDLFAEDGTCCVAAGACNGTCSSSSQVAAVATAVASGALLAPPAAKPAAALSALEATRCGGLVGDVGGSVVSPETAPTSLASTTDASPASRKSARRAAKTTVRFAAVA